MSTHDKINYLRGSIDAEYDAIMDKLPWYTVAALVASAGIGATAMTIACVGTLGLGCALAIVGYALALAAIFRAVIGATSEANELEVKADEMQELVDQLEANS